MSTEMIKAYKEGRTAGVEGVDLHYNPYPLTSGDLRDAWREGWFVGLRSRADEREAFL